MLFEPQLYHGTESGFFGTLVKRPMRGGRLHMDQWSHPISALSDWLRAAAGSPWDTALSPAEFFVPYRRKSTLRRIGLLWADCGDNGVLMDSGPEIAVQRVLEACEGHAMPPPSLIVSTGRGAHLKWALERMLPAQALPRWEAAERRIVSVLAADDLLAADRVCVAPNGVLRLVNTKNSKTGTFAREIWRNLDAAGNLVRYEFDRLCAEILPHARPDVAQKARRKHKRTRIQGQRKYYTAFTLWWGRYMDLQTLCRLRGWAPEDGGVPEGYRNTMLFLFAVCLSWCVPREEWTGEIAGVAEMYMPTLKAYEKRSFVSTVRSMLMGRSERSPSSLTQSQRYKLPNARIIEMLGISVPEMAHLKVLVLPEMAEARKRSQVAERRHAAYAPFAEATTVAKALRNEQICRMHEEGIPVWQIADRLDLSRPTVYAVLTADDADEEDEIDLHSP
jgi:Helix-turn-helix domain of resolvase